MSLEIAYILGAGLGTRMGAVGEALPKLLWPVFEKTLLELQVDYAIECGVKKIYLNTHFQAEKIQNYILKKKLNIEVLYEESLLDIGGAIHNLAKVLNYKGRVLILNGDQFLLVNKDAFAEFKEKSLSFVATLMGLKVKAGSEYNELVVEEGLLKSIERPSPTDSYYTYSGVSIINLSKLAPCEGKSKFFESVADFRKKEVAVFKPNEFEYWDFGTTERYINSMRKALLNKETLFKSFIIKNKSFEQEKIQDLNCYNSKGSEFSINLNNESMDNGTGNIIIRGVNKDTGNSIAVIYDGEVSKV
ncbi:sugar phosphate nucleotidyltransferase [Halobacteriovorax sp. JY17]|uniref:nucleotidyltransferase family protein n=1 Tax=Halobacteriovorax sp. JY17 TaxID=2014617 RepID=UPI000C6AC8A0|nr:sugar phosphate nucleotidyltransferase [Halobacteriovorax sp. JY17]PIK14261.1 MAG: hypothetical protein CES88_14900 [Halobacteriovorax sp. JY17]